ncbi:glycosyltransferase family 2 protein [Megasphaera sp. SW808]|uniref:glycosyltransferase family 2 protein n=1 Tax=Megasphaera sp. SW808 TaxID=2530045 RepID=UPI001439AF90|nr:glycosyltransferase family A protein [Megasphaera sp. SW808]NJE34676.1 glycosyltransferase family 2 protein [Megasphaera sp. SW808]
MLDITVFTPTYNRGYILPTLYQSLRNQTVHSFEWVIIDDGSIDNTQDMVNTWKWENNFFNIVYVKTENGGKHRAINRGIKLAKGRLFFIVDSDDYLINNALARILYWEKTIQNKNKFAGVCGNKMYSNGNLIGKSFCGQILDCKAHERKKYGIAGDKAEVYYTDILRKYPFPAFENETFLSEAVVWNRISVDGYKLRFFNESIYVAEYREDGLTHNIQKKLQDSINGTLLYLKEWFFLQDSVVEKIKVGSQYIFYGRKKKKSFVVIKNELKSNVFLFFFLMLAFGGRLIRGR